MAAEVERSAERIAPTSLRCLYRLRSDCRRRPVEARHTKADGKTNMPAFVLLILLTSHLDDEAYTAGRAAAMTTVPFATSADCEAAKARVQYVTSYCIKTGY